MKLFSIIIYQKRENIVVYKDAYYLDDISFFVRGKTKEFLQFISKTVASRIKNQKICINEQDNMIYAYDNNKYTITATTDKDYPQRVIFTMMEYILYEIEANKNFNLDEIIKKYQNPNEADKILKVQKDIAITKIVMLDTIDKVLERGEKIDDLILKSNDLSESGKMFYKDAKKMNSWCSGCVLQ